LISGCQICERARASDDLREPGHHVKIIVQPAAGWRGVPAMKAAVYYQPGGPEVFRYEDVPDPELTPDGVLVRVECLPAGTGTVGRTA
jgi:hypothetical protein